MRKLLSQTARHRFAQALPAPFTQRTLKNPLLEGLMAIALGSLMGLTFAPSPGWWLAWIAVMPLWVLVGQAHTLRQAAVWGGCWGIGCYGTALFWVLGLHPLTWLGMSWTTSLAIATLCWIFVTLWGACVPLLWAVSLRWVSPNLDNRSRLIVGAALWCALEWLWGHSPLWWPDLLNSQSPHNLTILHLSQLSGPTTVTLGLMGVNGLLSEAWLSRQRKYSGLAILLGLLLHGMGWGLAYPLDSIQPANPLAIGIVQGNIPTRIKLSPAGIRQSIERYEQGYGQLAAQQVDAVLFSEGALPFLWGRSPNHERTLLAMIREANIPAWVGTFRPDHQSYTQSLLNVMGDGSISSQYNKVKLVPLGEYLPFGDWLQGILHRLSPIQLGMVAGRDRQIFTTPFGSAIVGICYDSTVSELFRAQAAAGGQFILSVANNDPFSDRMMAQHHALDVIRAIETDRWLVRATNTGLSAVISPSGQTLWRSPINTFLTHVAHIERRHTQTLYVKFGNWLLPILILWSLGLVQSGRHQAFSPMKNKLNVDFPPEKIC